MPGDKLTTLYNNLKTKNPNFTVSEDQFRTDMSDGTKRQTLYNNLKQSTPDFTVPFEQFSSDMGYGQPTTPTTAQEPLSQTQQQQPITDRHSRAGLFHPIACSHWPRT